MSYIESLEVVLCHRRHSACKVNKKYDGTVCRAVQEAAVIHSDGNGGLIGRSLLQETSDYVL
jgi:hypothetical protein